MSNDLLLLYNIASIIAVGIYILIVVYFYRKYQDEQITISLHWLVAFVSFMTATLYAVLVANITDIDLVDVDQSTIPFIAIGMGFLALSTVELDIYPSNPKFWQIAIGVLTLITALFGLLQIITIVYPLFFLLSFIMVALPYLYLAYRDKNLRLSLVTVALVLQTPVSIILIESSVPIIATYNVALHKIAIIVLDLILAVGLMAFKKEE